MKHRIELDDLKKEDLNINGDVYVEDPGGVEQLILESHVLVPVSGSNAPAQEITDVVLTGSSYIKAHAKLLEYGEVPIPSPICLGCGASTEHPKTPGDRYCFECVKQGKTPCRSPGCKNGGHRDDVGGVTLNYCKQHDPSLN